MPRRCKYGFADGLLCSPVSVATTLEALAGCLDLPLWGGGPPPLLPPFLVDSALYIRIVSENTSKRFLNK